MVRRGAAATAEQPRAGVEEAPRGLLEVVGRAEEHRAAVHLAGRAGVGLDRDRLPRHRHELLDDAQHGLRSDGAVHADHVGAPRVETRAEVLGAHPVEAHALAVDGHLADERKGGRERAAGEHRRVDLGRVAERLEAEPVHPALDEPADLPGVERLGLGERRRAPGLHADPEGAHRAEHDGRVARGAPPDLGRAAVDLLRAVGETVALELRRVRAEGVRLEHLGAGAEVVPVDALDEFGRDEVHLVERPVDVDPPRVEERPHRAVGHHGAAREAREQVAAARRLQDVAQEISPSRPE